MEPNAEIGITDINGKPIRNGDRVRVRHVNYRGQQNEFAADEFTAVVSYVPFQAMFKYYPEGVEDHEGYIFNHRSSTFEVLQRSKY